MLSSIYYGEIQSDKLVSWNENKDPYNILVENNRVYKLGGWEFLDIANKLFDNEKQVDWGSYAYQCTKEQLEKLMEQTGCEIDKINELASEKIYGIVFGIESREKHENKDLSVLEDKLQMLKPNDREYAMSTCLIFIEGLEARKEVV